MAAPLSSPDPIADTYVASNASGFAQRHVNSLATRLKGGDARPSDAEIRFAVAQAERAFQDWKSSVVEALTGRRSDLANSIDVEVAALSVRDENKAAVARQFNRLDAGFHSSARG